MGSERANKLLLVVLEQHESVTFLRLKNSSGKTCGVQSKRLGSGATLGPTLDRGLADCAKRGARREETSVLQQLDIKSRNSADIERCI